MTVHKFRCARFADRRASMTATPMETRPPNVRAFVEWARDNWNELDDVQRSDLFFEVSEALLAAEDCIVTARDMQRCLARLAQSTSEVVS